MGIMYYYLTDSEKISFSVIYVYCKIINSYNASIKRKTALLDHASGAVEDLDAVPRVPAAVVGREVAFRQVFLKNKKCIKSIEQL